MNRRVTAASLLAVIVSAVQAQNSVTWNAGQLHPCTGDSVQVEETMEFTGSGENISLKVLGMTKTWTNYNDYQLQRSDFIHGSIELAGLQCAGAGGAVSMPATAASATFRQAVFSVHAVPRAAAKTSVPIPESQTGRSLPELGAATADAPEVAPAEQQSNAEAGNAVELDAATREAAPATMLPPNHVTTDLEWDLFQHRESSGNNYAVRAGYSRTISDKTTLGGVLISNTLLMMERTFFNNALNLYGTRLLSESSALERRVGGALNLFLVDKTLSGAPFGVSFVANFSDNWFIGSDNVLTYGVIVQQSFLAEAKTTLLTAGVLYGLPISDRFAINADMVYAQNLLTVGKNGSVKIDNPVMLQPAITVSTYFSRLFSLDLGVKKTFLIKEYSDLILTLGGTALF